jgi:hypothetical protein
MKRKCFSSIFGDVGARRGISITRIVNEIGLARARLRDTRDPKNPRFWPAKKSPLPPAKNPLFCTFRGEKRAISTELCTKMHIFDTFFADIAPGLWAASPSGKNPPIYTVLNAAFSAPGPPRLWHRGGTPVPDALTRAPVRPIDIFDEIEKSINYFSGRISPTT